MKFRVKYFWLFYDKVSPSFDKMGFQKRDSMVLLFDISIIMTGAIFRLDLSVGIVEFLKPLHHVGIHFFFVSDLVHNPMASAHFAYAIHAPLSSNEIS